MSLSEQDSSETFMLYLKFRYDLEFDAPTVFTLDRIERDLLAFHAELPNSMHCFPPEEIHELEDILTTLTMKRTRKKDKDVALNRLKELDPYGYYTFEDFMLNLT